MNKRNSVVIGGGIVLAIVIGSATHHLSVWFPVAIAVGAGLSLVVPYLATGKHQQ